MYIVCFCSFNFLPPLFIPPKFILKLFWLFFTSSSFILPFLILSIKSNTLSYLLNSSLGVLSLYLYIKSSRLTFLSNSVISLSLLSASSWNIYFCLEIYVLSSSSEWYFSILLARPWSWIAFVFFSPWSSVIFICFSKAFPKGE